MKEQVVDKNSLKTKIVNPRLVYSTMLIIFFVGNIGAAFRQDGLLFFKSLSTVLYGVAILILLVPLIRIQIIDRKYRNIQPLMKITIAGITAVKRFRNGLKAAFGIWLFFIVLMIWADFKDGVSLVEAIIENGYTLMNWGFLAVLLSVSYNLNETYIYEEGVLSLVHFSKWENIVGYRWQKYPNKKGDSYASHLS